MSSVGKASNITEGTITMAEHWDCPSCSAMLPTRQMLLEHYRMYHQILPVPDARVPRQRKADFGLMPLFILTFGLGFILGWLYTLGIKP